MLRCMYFGTMRSALGLKLLTTYALTYLTTGSTQYKGYNCKLVFKVKKSLDLKYPIQIF